MSTTTRSPPARVSALRTLSIVLAFTAAVGLIFGTGGFTAMEADRGLSANVTGDDSAYLGYEPIANETDSGESTPVVAYQNRFSGDLDLFDVDVSIANPESTDASVDSTETPEEIGDGDAAPVNVTLTCSEETDVDLLFEADGSGAGVSVSLDRIHTVTCVPDTPDVTGVTFNDAANGRMLVDGEDGETTANVWIAETPPTERVENLTVVRFDEAAPFDTSEKIRKQVVQHPSSSKESGENWKIVAVECPEQNVTYVHPGWNAGVYETPNSGDGVEYDGAVDEEFLLNAAVEDGQVVDTGSGDENDD